MGDVTMGVILLLVTGFLWVTGAILHWHTIKRQERLLARMRRLSGPPARTTRRSRARRAAGEAVDGRLTAGPLPR